MRISAKHANASRWQQAHLLSLNLKMGPMAEMATVAWTVGDDPFAIAGSLRRELGLSPEWQQTLYHLVTSHEVQMNLSLPALEPAPWDVPPGEVAAFTMDGRVGMRRHYIDESRRRDRGKPEPAWAHRHCIP